MKSLVPIVLPGFRANGNGPDSGFSSCLSWCVVGRTHTSGNIDGATNSPGNPLGDSESNIAMLPILLTTAFWLFGSAFLTLVGLHRKNPGLVRPR